MKRGSIDHPKIKRLARLLKLRIFGAVGIMECLYHFTAEYAPDGGIGKFTDDEISDACDWFGESSKLIAMLTESGLIDAHPQRRLIVHDWSEHADDGVHNKLARGGLCFADGKAPKLHRLSKEERAICQEKINARRTHDERTESVCRGVALPSPALALPDTPIAPKGAYSSCFDLWWEQYPKSARTGKAAAYRAYQKAGKALVARGMVKATAVGFLQQRVIEFAASPKGNSEFVPHPATWLNQGRYDDDPAAWKSNGKHQDHEDDGLPLLGRQK